MQVPQEIGEVIFSKDVKEGGTWCGYNKRTGVFAALTNVRVKVGKPEGAVSRGKLVLDVLEGRLSFDDIEGAAGAGETPLIVPGADLPTLEPVLDLGAPYAPFNLIVARVRAHTGQGLAQLASQGQASWSPEVFWLTNMGAQLTPADIPRHPQAHVHLVPLAPTKAAVVRLAPGVHGLSNSVLNDRAWAKVQWTRDGLGKVMGSLPLLGELDKRYQVSGHGAHGTQGPRGGQSGAHVEEVQAQAQGGARPGQGLGAAAGAMDFLPVTATTLQGSGGAASGQPSASITREHTPADPGAMPHPAHTDQAELQLLEELLRGITPVMTHATPLGHSTSSSSASGGEAYPSPDLSWSPLPATAEALLQSHVFIPPHRLGQATGQGGAVGEGMGYYGTRSLTVFARVGSHSYMAHRSFDPQDGHVLRAGGPVAGLEGASTATVGTTSSGLATAEASAAGLEASRLGRRVLPHGADTAGAASSSSGVVHSTVAGADAAALAHAVSNAGSNASGVGVAVELVRGGTGAQGGTGQASAEPQSTTGPGAPSTAGHGHPTATLVVAGLEWAVFRCPLAT